MCYSALGLDDPGSKVVVEMRPGTVRFVKRRSRVLSPSQIHCLSRLPTINLTAGCLHDCAYCYITGYSGYPGRGTVTLYADTAERLDRELARMKEKPRAVYFSPSSDLFQPHPTIHAMGERVLRVLFAHRVGVAILTKGEIPPASFALLAANADRVQAQIGLTTLDPEVASVWEPGAAAPATRIEQAAALRRSGVAVQARLDPILPGLTDDDRTLDALFAALASGGLDTAAAGVLFLRPYIARILRDRTETASQARAMLESYTAGPRITMRGTSSAVASLPASDRGAIFDRVTRIGARHGIQVRICACKNGDIAAGACNIAGRWSAAPTPRQGRLVWTDSPPQPLPVP